MNKTDGITRAETFAALKSLSEMLPQMRIGQLMAAIGELCADLHGRGLWDAEDVEFLEAVWRFRRGFEDSSGVENCQSASAAFQVLTLLRADACRSLNEQGVSEADVDRLLVEDD